MIKLRDNSYIYTYDMKYDIQSRPLDSKEFDEILKIVIEKINGISKGIITQNLYEDEIAVSEFSANEDGIFILRVKVLKGYKVSRENIKNIMIEYSELGNVEHLMKELIVASNMNIFDGVVVRNTGNNQFNYKIELVKK